MIDPWNVVEQAAGGFYAFWRYPLPPYFCGGKIVKMREDGLVQTENYGPGFYFKPVLILPAKYGGEKLLSDLDALDKEHRDAEQEFRKKYIEKAEALVGVKIEK